MQKELEVLGMFLNLTKLNGTGHVFKLNKIKWESECNKSVRRMASEFVISSCQISVSEFLNLYETVHFE